MGRRMQPRARGGRYTKATTQNMFGLHTDFCPQCRRLNAWRLDEPPPEACHACGAVMRPKARCGHCEQEITLLGGEWTDGDGCIACTDASAPFVPHKPAPEGKSEGGTEVSSGETSPGGATAHREGDDRP